MAMSSNKSWEWTHKQDMDLWSYSVICCMGKGYWILSGEDYFIASNIFRINYKVMVNS